MTQAQDDALKKVQELLGEHFPGHVLIFIEDVSGDGEEQSEARRVTYDGGFHQALGLIAKAHHHMMHGFDEHEEKE